MKITDRQKRNIVARVLSGETTYEAEAQRAGVSTRQIKRWVAAAKAVTPELDSRNVPSEDTSPDGIPPDQVTENGGRRTVLDQLLNDEKGNGNGGGAHQDGGDGPITQSELQGALVDRENFCVQAYAGLRAAVGSLLVQSRFSPPLDASGPEVLALLKVGVMADLAIRANAPALYPLLVKYASTWGALALAIAADAFGMVMALEGLAKSKGWKGAKKNQDGAHPVPDVKSATRPDRFKGAVGGNPADLREQIEAARAGMKATEGDQVRGAPVQTQTVGTINARAA